MRYLIVFLFLVLFIGGLTACDNTRQKIGVSTKPFQSGESFSNSTKLNWSITWGKIRSNKQGEED